VHPDVLLAGIIGLADGIVERFVGLVQRHGLAVEHYQEGVVGLQ
jgi:hypothetical protein